MLSKELLSEFTGRTVLEVAHIDGDELVYWFEVGDDDDSDRILLSSLYEMSKSYILSRGKLPFIYIFAEDICEVHLKENNDQINHIRKFKCENEIECMVEACDWLFKNPEA